MLVRSTQEAALPDDRAAWPSGSTGTSADNDAERVRRRAAVLRNVADARMLRAPLTPRRARMARLRALRASASGG